MEGLTIIVDTSNAPRLPLEEHQRISLYAAKLIARFPLEDLSTQRGCRYIEITPYANKQGTIERCGITFYGDQTKDNLLGTANLPRERLDGAINSRHFQGMRVTI